MRKLWRGVLLAGVMALAIPLTAFADEAPDVHFVPYPTPAPDAQPVTWEYAADAAPHPAEPVSPLANFDGDGVSNVN